MAVGCLHTGAIRSALGRWCLQQWRSTVLSWPTGYLLSFFPQGDSSSLNKLCSPSRTPKLPKIRKTRQSPDRCPRWPLGRFLWKQNLKFFDKIFVRKSSRRRFRNGLYGEEILLMGKYLCFVWAWFLQTGICSSMRGRYKIQSAEGWKWQRLFPNKRVRFARADKAVALQYQLSTDTNVCTVFTLGVIVGR